MTASAPSSVSLRLDDLEALFVPAPVDPLRGRFDDRSGVEFLLETLDASRDPVQLHLTLRHVTEGEGSGQQVEQALAGYAGLQLDRLTAELARIRRLALKELAFGVVFLASCLVAGSLLTGLEPGPYWLRGFVVEGLVIIGWIALWHPVDMLFFERLPILRQQRIWHRIGSASVRVRQSEDTAP